MTTTAKVLLESTVSPAVDTLMYSSDNCETAIDKLVSTNTAGTNVTMTIYLVPPAGAPAAENAISKTIPGGKSWPWPEIVGQILAIGGSIHGKASAAASISNRASGRQFT